MFRSIRLGIGLAGAMPQPVLHPFVNWLSDNVPRFTTPREPGASRAKRCPTPFPSYPFPQPAAASERSERSVNPACYLMQVPRLLSRAADSRPSVRDACPLGAAGLSSWPRLVAVPESPWLPAQRESCPEHTIVVHCRGRRASWITSSRVTSACAKMLAAAASSTEVSPIRRWPPSTVYSPSSPAFAIASSRTFRAPAE